MDVNISLMNKYSELH